MKWIIIFLIFNVSNVYSGVHTKNLWPYNEIKTCFAQPENSVRVIDPYKINVQHFPDFHRLWVITWVRQEYTAKRTGIHFIGFKDCEETPDADVVIFYNRNTPDGKKTRYGQHGLAFHGYKPGKIEGYSHAANFISISSSGFTKSTVIHEFGHVASLAHEQSHPDAYKTEKADCSSVKKEKYMDYFNYESYDRKSVMNYCWIHRVGNEMEGLSPGDVKTLRSLYR